MDKKKGMLFGLYFFLIGLPVGILIYLVVSNQKQATITTITNTPINKL
jgi:hypothetical protein